MNVDYAFLAGSAEVGADGKLYLLGADFTQLYGQYPYTVPSMALVAKIMFTPEEGGKKAHFSTEFRTPDGEKMDLAIEKDFDTPRLAMPDRKGAITILVGLQGVVFPMAGAYTIRVLVDGEEKKVFHLFAEDVPKPERAALPVG